jgi:aspartate-semialdehyde dehydrogenase
MVTVLEEIPLGESEFFPVASERSLGKTIPYKGKEYPVTGLAEAVSRKPQVALFSAGSAVSKEWAPRFADAGCTVIDNSSAWRRDPSIPLVVPEINAGILSGMDKIIANPNCSTIQMVLVLAPLHWKYRIRRVVVATYQSVTGSGAKGWNQLEEERKGLEAKRFFPHRIDLNLIPHAGDFTSEGYTTEEEKLAFETCKIIGDETVRVTATCVRVPVYGGHSEAVNIEFENSYELDEVRQILASEPGVIVQDSPSEGFYPMPYFARGRNEVFVGRIRRDKTVDHGLNLWIVSDNLRKGAATNAVQIGKYIVDNNLV